MIDINELRPAVEAAGLNAISMQEVLELLDRLAVAEKDIDLKERVIDSLRSALSTVANECNTPYSFDPTDNGTICVRCLKEKMKALLQLIQQPLSKVRTLSPEQIERHKLTAGECPSGSEVLLVSSVRRLLGCGIGDEKP